MRLTKILPEHVLGWEINLIRIFYADISARNLYIYLPNLTYVSEGNGFSNNVYQFNSIQFKVNYGNIMWALRIL